mgnify:CR=1 FL=1
MLLATGSSFNSDKTVSVIIPRAKADPVLKGTAKIVDSAQPEHSSNSVRFTVPFSPGALNRPFSTSTVISEEAFSVNE